MTWNGRIAICVGRNYALHAKEMKAPVPQEPFFFAKPATSYVQAPGPIQLPRGCGAQHEVELAVEIGSEAKKVPVKQAWKYIRGYRLAVDVTARTWQTQAKQQGLPWFLAKGADTFLPLGPLVEAKEIKDVKKIELFLSVNGQERQRDLVGSMTVDVPSLIHHITKWITLNPGDLLLTGTPSGVGDLKGGDIIAFGANGGPFQTQTFKCVDVEEEENSKTY